MMFRGRRGSTGRLHSDRYNWLRVHLGKNCPRHRAVYVGAQVALALRLHMLAPVTDEDTAAPHADELPGFRSAAHAR